MEKKFCIFNGRPIYSVSSEDSILVYSFNYEDNLFHEDFKYLKYILYDPSGDVESVSEEYFWKYVDELKRK
jgi:hypothetical protein